MTRFEDVRPARVAAKVDELREARGFTPSLHPRDRIKRFRDVLGKDDVPKSNPPPRGTFPRPAKVKKSGREEQTGGIVIVSSLPTPQETPRQAEMRDSAVMRFQRARKLEDALGPERERQDVYRVRIEAKARRWPDEVTARLDALSREPRGTWMERFREEVRAHPEWPEDVLPVVDAIVDDEPGRAERRRRAARDAAVLAAINERRVAAGRLALDELPVRGGLDERVTPEAEYAARHAARWAGVPTTAELQRRVR